eukprot:PhF_6_TR41320/c0_g4_i3/m.62613
MIVFQVLLGITIVCGEMYSSVFLEGQLGSFFMAVNDVSATYTLDVDFSNYTGSCDATNGVYYHLHTDWNVLDGSVSSTSCGAAVTGGHYDPTLACAGPSQYFATLCTSLLRTAAQGYTYRCNATGYRN